MVLRRIAFPLRLVRARLGAGGERLALVAVGVVAGAAVLAAVLAGRLVMQDRSLAEVVEAFEKNRATGSPVMNAEMLYHDPHVRAREMVVSVPDPDAVISESFRPRLTPLGLASPMVQLADAPPPR